MSWTIKKDECQRIDAFELWFWKRLLRIPWRAKRSSQSILKEISPEYSLEGLMLKLKLQIWPPDRKNWLTGKDYDARRDWRREEKGITKDEIVGWHHRLNGHEFEQALGDGEGQGILACCSPWGCKESDMIEWLNNKLVLKHKKTGSALEGIGFSCKQPSFDLFVGYLLLIYAQSWG